MTTFLLADIGGTHARFALAKDGAVGEPVKQCAADFETADEAFNAFCKENNCKDRPVLLIATAAQKEEDGAYRFVNRNNWVIDRKDLEAQGWQAPLIVNDFLASARGALTLPAEQKQVLKTGRAHEGAPCAILGPGTGLGLAYMHRIEKQDGQPGWKIQETMGAHMLAAAVTDEQHTIMKLVKRLKGNDTLLSSEDLASGRALPILHQAVLLYNGQEPHLRQAAELVEQADDLCVMQTLRLFHEFLGLFAHNVVVTGHAYGGLYLDGGVLHSLREKMLFDFKTFEKFMILNPVTVVRAALETTPVIVVKDPFVALHGVKALYEDGA